MKRQRGMVLVLALVFSLLLGLLAASALRDALVDMRMAATLRDGLQAFEEAEGTLLAGLSALRQAALPACQGCPPPPRPHELHGHWQASSSGYFQLQNLGETSNAIHMPEAEQVTLYRVTAVSRQQAARQVLEAVYAVPTAQAQAPRRILWRQRLKED
ncbi:hypothetical protein F3J45_06975 [Pantoea sp. Ap-967]|uniref:pilus assembly PilX family protein n=1 Tax=Pantoea sp. Ap-967 TaxID=2608362 RepID=UPI00141D936A|nr:PilX N-terminal domain-containing pilus assembly protein [Pantoea sp. Ap-967]NIE74178.1 hypothetical protein [Pantoea sp. Ap-967]